MVRESDSIVHFVVATVDDMIDVLSLAEPSFSFE